MKNFLVPLFTAICALAFSACGGTAEEQALSDVPQAEASETTAVQTETETTTTPVSAETSAETTKTETATETETTTEETAASTETEKICTCESEFQHACCEYLNEGYFPSGGIYYGDINGDGKPETVLEMNPFQSTCVLYENENGMQVLKLPTVACRGRVGYIADTKQILLNPQHNSSWYIWGYEEYHIYSWNGTDYEETASVYRKPGIYGGDLEHSEYGQAYIDGEEVDNDTFEVKLAEMQKLTSETGYFPIVSLLNDENFESYLMENFPCFDRWEIFPIYVTE